MTTTNILLALIAGMLWGISQEINIISNNLYAIAQAGGLI